jgi:hypothetical protein
MEHCSSAHTNMHTTQSSTLFTLFWGACLTGFGGVGAVFNNVRKARFALRVCEWSMEVYVAGTGDILKNKRVQTPPYDAGLDKHCMLQIGEGDWFW